LIFGKVKLKTIDDSSVSQKLRGREMLMCVGANYHFNTNMQKLDLSELRISEPRVRPPSRGLATGQQSCTTARTAATLKLALHDLNVSCVSLYWFVVRRARLFVAATPCSKQRTTVVIIRMAASEEGTAGDCYIWQRTVGRFLQIVMMTGQA
jgi:hypothetical protein